MVKHLIIILFACLSQGPCEENASGFWLYSTKTIITSNENDDVQSLKDEPCFAYCYMPPSTHKNILFIAGYNQTTRQYSENIEIFEYTRNDKFIVASGNSGNTKFIIDLHAEKFNCGQIETLLEKGNIVTKNSVGVVSFKKPKSIANYKSLNRHLEQLRENHMPPKVTAK